MRGYIDACNLPTSYKADDSRPVKREKAKPSGNAAKDGFTRHARHAPYGAPGDFMSADEADRYEKMMADMPSSINDY